MKKARHSFSAEEILEGVYEKDGARTRDDFDYTEVE